MDKTIEQRIKEIPGKGGWWIGSSFDTAYQAFDKLVSSGFEENEALDLLSSMYWAVAACYGD